MALNSLALFSGWSTRADTPAGPEVLQKRSASLEAVTKHDRDRALLETFIKARFAAAYGADITHFCPYLVGTRDPAGRWHASAGYTPARDGPLYIENYFEEPIELVLGGHCATPITRDHVVEVGNLAATSAGIGRELIIALARHLHEAGFVWVVFTATRELRNSFSRLGVPLISIARADPTCLHDRGVSWGCYYAHDPQVMAGDIPAAIQIWHGK